MNDLGKRIKSYEKAADYYLTPNSCVFIRVDGKAFHTYTKNFEKPFDSALHSAMLNAGIETANQMQGFKLGYQQSDEFTFMITDFDTQETQGWFGYRLNKLVSIAASSFTAYFNDYIQEYVWNTEERKVPLALFDARAFVVPNEDAPNVFVWRQKDWERNSITSLAQAYFTHKELNGKKRKEMHEMLHTKGVNWTVDLWDWQKNGTWLDKDFQISYDRKTYDEIRRMYE